MGRKSNQQPPVQNQSNNANNSDQTDTQLQVQTTAVVQSSNENSYLQVFDMNNGVLPDLNTAVEVPIDLMADYWTPEHPGEEKRVYFDRIEGRLVRDQADPNITLTLPCAFFYEKEAGKDARTISNGSKRLVGLIENIGITRGTALLITYLGKKKNSTNSYQSDRWSVKPLILNIK
jgi:hypothetical protein